MSTASDDFNRADGAIGASWGANGGTVVVSSNRAANSGLEAAARYSAVTWTADQSSAIVLGAIGSGGAAGPAVRMATGGASTYYVAIASGGASTTLYRVSSGTPTLLGSHSGSAHTTGDTFALVVVGTALTVKKNGATIISATDTVISGGAPGLYLSGMSASSADSWAGADVSIPADPSGLGATALSDSAIRLAWTDNSTTETGFAVERSPNGATGWAQIGTTGAGVVTYDDTGRSAATTYHYRVKATGSGGDSGYTSVANATTNALPAPTSLRARATSSARVHISWVDNATAETGYRVERATGDAGAFSEVASPAAGATFYPDTDVLDGTRYRYRVRAADGGGYSAYSATTTVDTPAEAPALVVEIAFTTDPLDESPVYEDVSDRVRADQPVMIRMGRQTELGRVEAGTASLTLDNRDRALDPDYASSPYYGYVIPGRRMRISSVYRGGTRRHFVGFARFAPEWTTTDHVCKVTAIDGLDYLARAPLVETVELARYTPTGGTVTLNLDTDAYGGGQVVVRTASAPSGTQTVAFVGEYTNGDAVSTVGSLSLTSSNYETGVTDLPVYGYLASASGSTGRDVIISLIPAFLGAQVGETNGWAGDQIRRVLNWVDWPAADWDADVGDMAMATWTPSAATGWSISGVVASGADTALTAIQKICDAEQGLFYIRGDGAAVFESQYRRRYLWSPYVATLGDGDGEIGYTDLKTDDGLDYVYNQARVTQLNGASFALDASAAEIARYGRRPWSKSGVLLGGSGSRAIVGRYIVGQYKAHKPRVKSLTLTSGAGATETMLDLAISDPVLVKLRPPAVGDRVDRPCFVEGLAWRIQRGRWSLTLGLSPADLVNDYYAYGGEGGVAFPTSPIANQRFYRTDLGLDCYYDGTRWLTTTISEVAFTSLYTQPFSSGPTNALWLPKTAYSRYLVTLRVNTSVATTNNGSHYWIATMYSYAGTNLGSMNTSAHSAGTRVDTSVTPGTTVVDDAISIQIAKSGSPGNLEIAALLRYRLIIT